MSFRVLDRQIFKVPHIPYKGNPGYPFQDILAESLVLDSLGAYGLAHRAVFGETMNTLIGMNQRDLLGVPFAKRIGVIEAGDDKFDGKNPGKSNYGRIAAYMATIPGNIFRDVFRRPERIMPTPGNVGSASLQAYFLRSGASSQRFKLVVEQFFKPDPYYNNPSHNVLLAKDVNIPGADSNYAAFHPILLEQFGQTMSKFTVR